MRFRLNNLSKATQAAQVEDLCPTFPHHPMGGAPRIPQNLLGNQAEGDGQTWKDSSAPGSCWTQQEWVGRLPPTWRALPQCLHAPLYTSSWIGRPTLFSQNAPPSSLLCLSTDPPFHQDLPIKAVGIRHSKPFSSCKTRLPSSRGISGFIPPICSSSGAPDHFHLALHLFW